MSSHLVVAGTPLILSSTWEKEKSLNNFCSLSIDQKWSNGKFKYESLRNIFKTMNIREQCKFTYYHVNKTIFLLPGDISIIRHNKIVFPESRATPCGT